MSVSDSTAYDDMELKSKKQATKIFEEGYTNYVECIHDWTGILQEGKCKPGTGEMPKKPGGKDGCYKSFYEAETAWMCFAAFTLFWSSGDVETGIKKIRNLTSGRDNYCEYFSATFSAVIPM